jgi:RNA polymerase sigma factor (sigma-70 family)
MATEYLAISGRYMLLSKEEEIYLGRRIQKWLTWEGECPKAVERSGKKARDRFVLANMRLVTRIAKSYTRRIQGTALTFEDLLQEGTIGLCRAAEKYDPECGYAASTYFTWWIRQALSRAVDAQARIIRVSTGARRKLKLFREAAIEGQSMEETLTAAGLKPKDLEFVRQASLCEMVVPLDSLELRDCI